MGDQLPPSGQGSNDAGNDQQSPPWLQTLVQQMNQMAQRIDAIDQRTQAQPSAPPLPVPPSEPPAPPPPNGPAQLKRPKPVLPDLSIFTGKRSEWPAWKDEAIGKLTTDGAAIGGPKEQFAYLRARVGGTAARTVLPFVQSARANNVDTPGNLLTYMENVYGDANLEERASNRLNTMTQGKEVFATFLPKFERTLAEAGGSDWTDQVKINTLKRMLNQDLRTALVYIPVHPTAYNDFVRTLQTLASRLATLNPRAPTAITPTTTNSEAMEWEPSVNKVRTPTDGSSGQKRAQWVSKNVLEERRATNKCLRCGSNDHFISNCKLLPARPPHQGQARVKTAEIEDDKTVVEEGSEPESGKE